MDCSTLVAFRTALFACLTRAAAALFDLADALLTDLSAQSVMALLRDRMRLFSMGLPAAATAFILALNLLNPDALIVRENVARYQATGDLDASYLAMLSPDAARALAAALPELGPARAPLEAHLLEQSAELAATAAHDGWPGWNLGRARAEALTRR